MKVDAIGLKVVCILLILVDLTLAGETRRHYDLPRLTGEMKLDGDLSDPLWKRALIIDHFYEISPGDNSVPVVRTIGYLGYDSDFLYAAVYAYDPHPEQIRSSFSDRDSVSVDQDFVQFDLDTKNDEKSSVLFRVNPRGVVGDAVFSEVSGVDDYSPDFSFQVAARIVQDGWIVEYKIPLSTLRYTNESPQTWGITFYRNYPRQFRRRMVSGPMPRGANCWLCYDIKLDGITGLPPSQYALIVPFATAQNESTKQAPDHSGSNLNGGLDLKWIPWNNLTIDGTLNPDFAQVEADAPQVNVNNRFALFYPEKRGFFLEGADLLNTPLNAIYTRTITDPDWGARGTGRFGGSSYTFLMASDAGGGSQIIPGPTSSALVPQQGSSLATIFRISRPFGSSLLGLVGTDRETESGFNRLIGPDILWRPTDKHQISAQWLFSDTKDALLDANDYALSVRWLFSEPSKFFQIDSQRLGHDFRADNGFVPQVGIQRNAATAGYRFYPAGWFWFVQPGFTWDSSSEIGDRLVSRSTYPAITMNGRWNSSLTMEYHIHEKSRTADQIHDFSYLLYKFQFQPSHMFSSVGISGNFGKQVDIVNQRVGDGRSVAFAATLRPTIHLNLELQGERQWLNIDQAKLFTADVAQAKVTYNFSPRMFVRIIGQHEKIDRNVTLYSAQVQAHEGSYSGSILYGYRFNWQTVFYVGYSGDQLLLDGTHYQKDSSHLFVKLAYAFEH